MGKMSVKELLLQEQKKSACLEVWVIGSWMFETWRTLRLEGNEIRQVRRFGRSDDSLGVGNNEIVVR